MKGERTLFGSRSLAEAVEAAGFDLDEFAAIIKAESEATPEDIERLEAYARKLRIKAAQLHRLHAARN